MDAVMTWVDGEDPKWQQKRARYIPQEPKGDVNAGTRYASVNEVLYSVGSILKFAPFFEHIYIITDEQTPPIFERLHARFGDDAKKIIIIDHSVIFANHLDLLPVYNSTSIESMMANIPHLSRQFVYFNDDFFLIRPVNVDDFFVNHIPRLRTEPMENATNYIKIGKYKIPTLGPWGKRKLSRARDVNLRTQANANSLAGNLQSQIASAHSPYAFRLDTLEAFSKKYPEALRQNASYRLRSVDQFNIPALYNALETVNGNEEQADHQLIYLKPANIRDKRAYLDRKLEQASNDESKLFMCVQSLDLISTDLQNLVLDWLEKRIFT